MMIFFDFSRTTLPFTQNRRQVFWHWDFFLTPPSKSEHFCLSLYIPSGIDNYARLSSSEIDSISTKRLPVDHTYIFYHFPMNTALIIVDPQNDFCEGGALGVPNSHEIFPIINILRKRDVFKHVFITLDWHPANHVSFAANHGRQPFTKVEIEGEEQMLWPTHCVQNSHGSNINEALEVEESDIIVEKGFLQHEESYSGFGAKKNPTVLEQKLKDLGIQRVIVVGLALDYCVGNTALDAHECGFKTIVVREATKSVSGETQKAMEQQLNQKGVEYKSIYELDLA